jgi:hypothetical protein
MPLPPELKDERLYKDLHDAAVAEWFNGYLGHFLISLTNDRE